MDEEEMERVRKENISKLVDSIRSRKPTRNSLKNKEVASNKVKATGRGRHIKYKIRIGWQNYSKGGYHLVTSKTGGGVRTIEYNKDDPQSVTTLTNLGKKLFFPGGISSLGNLEEFDVSLANYKGDPIKEFQDLDGKLCSFQEYLKAHGLYSSKYNVYLMTRVKVPSEDSSVVAGNRQGSESFLCNNAIPSNIVLKYSKQKSSLYSSNTISINCNCFKDCFMMSGLPDVMESEYNPIDDGFNVSSIAINGKKYLTKTIDGQYQFPESRQAVSNDTVIIHGPSEIFGVEQERLILGLITSYHNHQSAVYQWYKDGSLLTSGHNMSILSVTEPGIYIGAIEIDSTLYLADPPVNVEKSPIPLSSIASALTDSTLHSPSLTNFPLTTHASPADQSSAPATAIAPTLLPVLERTAEMTNSTLFPVETLSKISENASGLEKSPTCNENCGKFQTSRIISSKKRVSDEQINTPHSATKASVLKESDEVSLAYGNVSSVPRINHADISLAKEIGQGAFGVVFKGEWLETTVAVKKIKVKRMKIFEKNLHRELQIHSRIRHPNIVQLMAYTTDRDSLYLVSEYIEGYNLEEIIFGQEHGVPCLDIGLKCAVSKDLLQAVSYLHNINPVVVHRDIKPENVLASTDLKTVKLCDMGLSKLKTMTTLVTTFACKQAIQPGTPAYQAPELVVERKSATIKSDIWSLACTILEILIEDQVWNLDDANRSDDGDDDDTPCVNSLAKRMKKNENPDGLSLLAKRSEVPKAIVDIIVKGLSYKKDERPTALEMLKVFKNSIRKI